MEFCDICGGDNGFHAQAVVDKDGETKNLSLCAACWDELFHRERHHRYLAYEEVVEIRTGKKSSILDKLRCKK